MKKNYFLGLLFSIINVSAQVGINTNSPQAALHVHGETTLDNSLNVGGNESTKGNPGIAGQILQSSGPGKSPSWTGIENVLSPNLFFKRQTTPIFLPSGFNKPWLQIPNLSQTVSIPKGKKAMIFITGQICAQQTKDKNPLFGISAGIFKENDIKISNTAQLTNESGFTQEFIIIPITYTEFLFADTNDLNVTYNIKSRANYTNGDNDDLRVVNDPFTRGDYSELRISVLIF